MDRQSQGQFPRPIEMLNSRFTDPTVRASLNGITKTLQVSFTDLKEDYVLIIRDGELAKLEKRNLAEADVTVTLESSLMEGILSGKSHAVLAYVTGKLKVKGSMEDLLRLQKLLG